MNLNNAYEKIKEKINNGTIECSDIRGLIFDYTMDTRLLCRNGCASDIREYTDKLLDFQYLLSTIKKNPDKYKDSEKLILEYEKFVELRRFCIAVFPDVREYANYIKEYLYDNPNSSLENICEDMCIKRGDAEKALLWLKENNMIESEEFRVLRQEEYDNVHYYYLTKESKKEIGEDTKKKR